jgi:hypothetical protein
MNYYHAFTVLRHNITPGIYGTAGCTLAENFPPKTGAQFTRNALSLQPIYCASLY